MIPPKGPRIQHTVYDGQSGLVEPGDAMVLKQPYGENCKGQQEHEDEQIQALDAVVQRGLRVQSDVRVRGIASGGQDAQGQCGQEELAAPGCVYLPENGCVLHPAGRCHLYFRVHIAVGHNFW